MPLAPRAEQDRIIEAIEEQFDRLDSTSSALFAAMRRIETLRRAVIVRAFAGQLVQ